MSGEFRLSQVKSGYVIYQVRSGYFRLGQENQIISC